MRFMLQAAASSFRRSRIDCGGGGGGGGGSSVHAPPCALLPQLPVLSLLKRDDERTDVPMLLAWSFNLVLLLVSCFWLLSIVLVGSEAQKRNLQASAVPEEEWIMGVVRAYVWSLFVSLVLADAVKIALIFLVTPTTVRRLLRRGTAQAKVAAGLSRMVLSRQKSQAWLALSGLSGKAEGEGGAGFDELESIRDDDDDAVSPQRYPAMNTLGSSHAEAPGGDDAVTCSGAAGGGDGGQADGAVGATAVVTLRTSKVSRFSSSESLMSSEI